MLTHTDVPGSSPQNREQGKYMYVAWNQYASTGVSHRYGTCGALSTSAVITLPRVSKLWLMLPASLARLSTAPERPIFSLPARSTCIHMYIQSVQHAVYTHVYVHIYTKHTQCSLLPPLAADYCLSFIICMKFSEKLSSLLWDKS